MSEQLHIFDPRRSMHVQGFSGRAATTTLHDASATGVSISGIFQTAEDFAVLGFWNAYDYFNHLRLKPLPRRDLSGLKLEFDIEYDHALDGAMRFDANKYPSVSWDAMTFVCGAGDIYEVRLLDHASVVAGGETPASCRLDAFGICPTDGLDWLHLYFRDTRYTVASDQVEGTAYDVMVRFAEIINTAGEEVEGRYGPDQSGVITATVIRTGPEGAPSAALMLTLATPPLPAARYGKLGNLDRVLVTSGHDGAGGQNMDWTGPRNPRFTGGDNDTRYHITLDFTQPLLDKLDRAVPMNDCRKMYMVFAPRFERVEEELEDGCFLTTDATAGDTMLHVDDASKLTGGRYFIGDSSSEERLLLVCLDSTTEIAVQRGYQNSPAAFWPAGTRLKKVSPVTGIAADIEWGATISNITVTGNRTIKVGGAAPRIEESDGRCKYTGYWEDYKYAGGFPTQWWSGGHARRTTSGGVTVRYSYPTEHDLYLGTFLNTDCGQISVTVDGDPATEHDLYLNEYGGTAANLKLRESLPGGTHEIRITAISGGWLYFDYLWPLEPQDVPDPPKVYDDVSLAIDFDTDHGYKKPPAWHLWQLQKLGFKGHADVYMGVFWNNKRRRIDASYPYATVQFSGDPVPGDVVWFEIGGTRVSHAIGYGETLQQLVSHMRATLNGMFSGVWADDNFGASDTLRIQSKAPGWTFTGIAVSEPNSVTLTLDDRMGTAGNEGEWEMIDAVSPVMTEGARKWIRDLAGQFQAADIKASFAFSMECYRPPMAMAARYWDGEPAFLPIPSHHMHFGPRVRNYLKQMYKECADEIAAAGLPIVLQFGETQWWYFPNASGMPFYDDDTKAAFQARYGRPLHRFLANTDSPNGDIESANFLRDRIWEYCQEVITHVRQFHPTAVFECLWPLDANQGKPAPDPAHRALNMHVNLPDEWKNSSYGIKYFRAEGFDYDVWQKNANLMARTLAYPFDVLGRPADECIYLAGIYGPPDPPMAQAYGLWRAKKLYSMCFWAFDQFCLNSRPVPLETWAQAAATAVQYHKPRAARAYEAVHAIEVVAPAGGALNRFKANQRRLN